MLLENVSNILSADLEPVMSYMIEVLVGCSSVSSL